MFKAIHALKPKVHLLLAVCFLVLGLVALVAAPSVFVQHGYASGESCSPETPCGEDQYCCDGTCQDCPCDE